jgi:hypothetical protein
MLLALQKRPIQSVCFVIAGEAKYWDVDSWPVWRHLSSIATPELGIETNLILPESIKRSLPWPIVHSLISKANARNSKVLILPDSALRQGECTIAGIVSSPDKSITWGVFDPKSLAVSANWGQGTGAWPVIKGTWEGNLGESRELSLDAVEKERPEDCTQVLINRELNGDILNVGNSFWSLLQSKSGLLKTCLEQGMPTTIEYSDRYVRSPLSVRVFFELVKRFASTSANRVHLTVNTTASAQYQSGHGLHHDWVDDKSQKGAFYHLFEPYFRVSINVHAKPQDLCHSRHLSLNWENGSCVELNFDQGVGFFRTIPFKPFDFQLPNDVQAIKLASLRFSVENQSAAMPLYVLKPQ